MGAGALESLKVAKLFAGARGASAADAGALAEMAARVSWLAYDLCDDITELDINLVIVMRNGVGAFAVDALVVTRDG
jgi:hypothetical protein